MSPRNHKARLHNETAGITLILATVGFAIVVLIFLSIALFNHDELRIGRFMQDSLLWADAIYRMSHGQEIHRDFQTPIGTLMFVVPYFFYSLTDSISVALKAGHFAFGAAVLVASLILTVGRIQTGLAFALALFCCLAVATPVMFGGSHQDLTIALHYNRIGWTALFIISLALLPRKYPTPFKLLSDSAVVAALVTLLFFTKISFFLSVIGLFAIALWCFPLSRRLIAVSAISSAVVLCTTAIVASSVFWAYLDNVTTVVAVSGNRLKPLSAFLNVKDELLLFLAGCIAVAGGLLYSEQGRSRVDELRILLMLAAVLAMSLLNFNQNFQYRILMTLIFPWFWAANIVFLRPRNREALQFRAVSSVVSFLIICLVLLGPITNWARALRIASKPIPNTDSYVRFEGALEGIVQRLEFSDIHESFRASSHFELTIENFPDQILSRLSVIYWRNTQLGMSYIDGLEVLRPLLKEVDDLKIETIDFMNPFPIMTGTGAPRGVMIARSLREIDFEHPPLPEQWFLEPDIIMIPKYPQDRSVSRSLVCAYSSFLTDTFEQVQESGYWIVLQRRDAESLASSSSLYDHCN